MHFVNQTVCHCRSEYTVFKFALLKDKKIGDSEVFIHPLNIKELIINKTLPGLQQSS